MLGVLLSFLLVASSSPAVLTAHHISESEWTNETLTALAADAADRYHLNRVQFLKTFICEIKKNPDGTWDYTAQSDIINKRGERENSWGMWQINLDVHDITRAEAQNPVWATEWAAQEFAAGRAWQWTCFRVLSDA